MKRGFTLVELSIVLVIIGLLIGGILAARSMVNTVKIQGVVRQLQQYDIAVSNFRTKYNQLPGDFNNGSSNYPNNGQIDDFEETQNFWVDLSAGVSLKNSKKTDYVAFDIYNIPNTEADCPRFKISRDSDNPCLYAVRTTPGFGSAGYAVSKNYYFYNGAMDDGTQAADGIYSHSIIWNVIKSADALAIDKKIDDGIWNSGSVVTTSAYDLSNTGYSQNMAFEIGGTGLNINNY